MNVTYGRPAPNIVRKTPPKDFVPKDFSEMYQRYYVYVLKLLVAQGITYQNADDVAQIIFIKMDEKGLLDQFDPEREFNGRTAIFSTFISGFVLKYLRHYRAREVVRIEREGQSLDAEVDHADGSSYQNSTWGEVYGPHFEEEYTELHDEDFKEGIRRQLRKATTGRRDNQLDLVALFDEIDRQVELDGKYTTSELGRVFGVSRTTIHTWLEKLRIEVSAATNVN